MANAEQMKALIRSHADGDNTRFYAVAIQVAAHAARSGHNRFAQELRELVDERLPELQQIVQMSAEDGDLTDNSEWEESKDELARAQHRIDDIRAVLDTYTIFEGTGGETVELGSSVRLRRWSVVITCG